MSEVSINDCHICPLAKKTCMPFSLSKSLSLKPFSLIHMDLWGPYIVETYDHKRFFLTMVDDYTRFT